MERPLTLKPLSIQDENSAVHRKKATLDGKSKISRPLAWKGGVAVENRKALNDITNKSSAHPEATSLSKKSEKKKLNIAENGGLHQHVESDAPSKKKCSVNEKLNIAEEGFLHDHSKCIDAQKEAVSERHFLDTILPGHDSKDHIIERPKDDPDKSYPKLEVISESEFSDWFKSCWKSPPLSPVHQYCPLPFPSEWELKEFELSLKEDDNGDV